uniref:Uncharacterized protein n=1 Tax=Brassica campestris TaxID=3711 RepID=M4E0Y4_BRACM|nr:unnamed protein product [Brassica rapa]
MASRSLSFFKFQRFSVEINGHFYSKLRHTTPALFYLALGGSLLSYIYSAPPLKLGIAIVYNFKSVEGDRAMGLQSLLVAFGTEAAKWICVSAIDVTQISVAGM